MRRCGNKRASQTQRNAPMSEFQLRKPVITGPHACEGSELKRPSGELSRVRAWVQERLPIEARLFLVSMGIVCLASLAALELRFL